MNQRFIRLREVQSMVGIGRTKIYAKIKTGTFPRQIKLGRVSGWVEAEVQEWISLQIQQSRNDGSPRQGIAKEITNSL